VVWQDEFERHYEEAMRRCASGGNVQSAVDYIKSITDEDHRNFTLSRIAVHLARLRQADAAALARDVGEAHGRAIALRDVAREFARQGATAEPRVLLAEAERVAEGIPHSTWETPTVLLGVSVELHNLAESADALRVLRRAVGLAQGVATGDFDAAKTLGGASVLLSSWGYPEEARSVAESIPQERLRKYTLDRLARPPKS